MAMRMGGVDTQGDRGVMAGAMQAAQMKASAQDQSGINSLAGNVMDWASDIQKEDRQVRLEDRASKRGIAKEKRTAGVLAEQRDYDKPYREAQISELKARERKADRWEPSGKADKTPSQYTIDGAPIDIGQAKLAMNEFKNIDPELVAQNKAIKTSEVIKYLDDKGMDSTNLWTSESDAEDFIALYEIDPAAAKKEDSKAFKFVDEALGGYNRYEGLQDFLDSKYSGGTTSVPTPPTGGKVVYRKVAK